MIKAFDLSGVEGAELTFDTWYEIEEAWDYGFCASVDGRRRDVDVPRQREHPV